MCVGEFFDGSSSKLSVASTANQYQEICWWFIGLGFAFSVPSFTCTDSLFFIVSCLAILIALVPSFPETLMVCRERLRALSFL